MGPNSRAILEAAAENDVSAAAFPFFTAQEVQIGGAPVRALRITYMGELGLGVTHPNGIYAHRL